MNPETWQLIIEMMGYVASVMVLISLLMSSVIKLRIINSLGALVYVIYALIIGSYPTALLNAGLIIVNVYFLIKLLKAKSVYSVCESNPQESGVEHFLNHYRTDISKYFPDYSDQMEENDQVWVVYADANPAGILIGSKEGNAIRVRLDYSTPQFRDCSVGKFLYTELRNNGVAQLIANASTDTHKAYLKKMGFVEKNGCFIKTL